jgi:hypothetical protein
LVDLAHLALTSKSLLARQDSFVLLSCQVASLIAELASAVAEERGLTFDEGIEERLCAYARAVAHFPTAVKEASPT